MFGRVPGVDIITEDLKRMTLEMKLKDLNKASILEVYGDRLGYYEFNVRDCFCRFLVTKGAMSDNDLNIISAMFGVAPENLDYFYTHVDGRGVVLNITVKNIPPEIIEQLRKHEGMVFEPVVNVDHPVKEVKLLEQSLVERLGISRVLDRTRGVIGGWILSVLSK